jgi:hypothetical protein
VNDTACRRPDPSADAGDRALDAVLAGLHDKQLSQVARRLDLDAGLALIVGGMSCSGKGAYLGPPTHRLTAGEEES